MTDYQEVFERTARVIRGVLGDPALALSPQSKAIQVRAWDSLAHTSILLGLEAEFGKELDPQKGMEVADLDQLVRLVIESQSAQ